MGYSTSQERRPTRLVTFFLIVFGALPALAIAPLGCSSDSGSSEGPPKPVEGHPRLWLTANDLPRLQSWATASNPVYQNGILKIANQLKVTMDAGKVPSGDKCTDDEGVIPCESYAEMFAFMSLLSTDQGARDDY